MGTCVAEEDDSLGIAAICPLARGLRRQFFIIRKVLIMPCKAHPALLCRRFLLTGMTVLAASAAMPASAQETVKLGLVAAMSGQSAKSGEAIVRGISLAFDEINDKGGVLGKKVELLVRDDESNPARGAVAARELVQREKVAALFGGLDTPVSLA